MENKVIKAKDLEVDDAVAIYNGIFNRTREHEETRL